MFGGGGDIFFPSPAKENNSLNVLMKTTLGCGEMLQRFKTHTHSHTQVCWARQDNWE